MEKSQSVNDAAVAPLEGSAVVCYDPSNPAARRWAGRIPMNHVGDPNDRPGRPQPADTPTGAFATGAVELTVIVPTRNETDNVTPLLDRLGDAMDGHAFEILFVDDSTDDTAGVIQRESKVRPFPVSVIARPESRRDGLSGAVVEGMAAARGRWMCVIDADLQHPPEIIPRLLDQANRTGADIVVASRQADLLGPVGLSRARAFTSQVLTILARMVFPRVLKNVSDPLTGFFLVRRAAIDTAVLQPQGFKILLEILVRHPDMRVTEMHFDFAPRREGQSKADLNEGMRFFRHLTRLRLTVNQHLIRFLIVVVLAVVINLASLGALTAAGWTIMGAAAVAGTLTIAGVLLGETWVFSDRPRDPMRRRMAGVLVSGILFLTLVYLPVIWLVAVRLGAPTLVAGSAAMVVAGFVYYLLSEQWIWTRGLMMRPRASLYYDIHGLVTVASQIPVNDLAFFQVSGEPDRVDLQVRIDRHGTPSRVPGSISYDEQLGRFGFGLTVIPGDFTEIVVSPLLEASPAFLYTNVVEPVLQWLFVRRGYCLAYVGGVQQASSGDSMPLATLITGQPDMSYGLSRLCETERLAFLGDDRVIIGRDRRVYSFPKPVTANRDMLAGDSRTLRGSLSLRLQRRLYSRPVRRLGLFLSKRRLPAATVNTYLQRIIPQPKYPLDNLAQGISYGDRAFMGTLVRMEKGEEDTSSLDLESAVRQLLDPGQRSIGFNPYPLLIDELGRWEGQDWAKEERAILRSGLAGGRLILWRTGGEHWWERISGVARARPTEHRQSLGIVPIKTT